jgi:hypothetical protein
VRAGEKDGCQSYCTAYLWIVPAKVGGVWHLPGGDLTLKQEFQKITGSIRTGGLETPIKGKLSGDQITFTAGSAQYSGSVSGNSIKGTVKDGASSAQWSATRSGKPAS